MSAVMTLDYNLPYRKLFTAGGYISLHESTHPSYTILGILKAQGEEEEQSSSSTHLKAGLFVLSNLVGKHKKQFYFLVSFVKLALIQSFYMSSQVFYSI